MASETDILNDPNFQHMLARRSRWRWGLSLVLIGTYFAYCVAGIYMREAFGRPVPGTSIPWVVALGYSIIVLTIVLSVLYIRVVGRLLQMSFGDRGSRQ